MFNGMIQDGGGSNTLALLKAGAGTLTLGGANTFSGGTTVSGGVLKAASAAALGGSQRSVSVVAGGALYAAGGINLANAVSVQPMQTLVAGWDFQTATNGGTAIVGTPNTQTSFVANFGSGTMYLDGTHGSSGWSQAAELDANNGTTVNGGVGFSTYHDQQFSYRCLPGRRGAERPCERITDVCRSKRAWPISKA